MTKIWRWVRRWWWTIVAGVISIAGFFFLLLIPKSERITRPEIRIKKPLKERAREEIERARLEGEIEKARKRTKARVERRWLDEIEHIGKKNPVMARKQLAYWLDKNL